MRVIFNIALRNLLEHKAKSLIVGSIIALGVVIAAILLARLNRMSERQAADGGRQPLFSMELFDNRTFFAAWSAAAERVE